MSAIRPPARLVAALAGAVALLTLAPASATALTCIGSPLGSFESEEAAFVGQVLERGEEVAVVSVLEGFKGVATGEVVELVVGRYEPAGWTWRAAVGDVLSVFAGRDPEGRLRTGICRSATPDAMRAAAAAAAQGRTCTGDVPRIISAVPRVRGRELSLRVVVADGRERAHTVRVFWGAPPGVPGNVQTVKRVPRSHTLLLRHRYRRTGRTVVRVQVEQPPPLLCDTIGRPNDKRDVTVRLRPAHRPATRR